MTTYRCQRPVFGPEEYEAHGNWFWPMPSIWGTGPDASPLPQLWQAGGSGGIGILPVLGVYANAPFADGVDLSKEYIARLTGLSVDSVRAGARAFKDCQLGEPWVAKRFGKRLTRWRLHSSLAVSRTQGESGSTGFRGEYFYFSARLLYGGHWHQLGAGQRALFLGLATRAKVYSDPPGDGPLRYRVPRGVPLVDLQECYEASPGGAGHLRLVLDVSVTDLEQITGVGRSTLLRAIQTFKHPNVWPGARNDTWRLLHAPLAVYPGDGGTLVYHFRDHAAPWAWSTLNRRSAARRVDAASDFLF